MLCDDCRKNDASIHIRRIVEDQVEIINLCSECAKARGLDKKTEKDLAKLVFSMTSNLMGKKHESSRQQSQKALDLSHSVTCPECGMTLESFSKSGRFGCSECYAAFAEILPPIIESVQRGKQHAGRIPPAEASATGEPSPRSSGHERLRFLREELSRAVATESYEQAARLRDEINELENGDTTL